MKSKVSPTAIGIFIAGAIVILFSSIILFGSGNLFRQTKSFLLTFREPVTGLKVGAPVKLLGVEIGSVSEVTIGLGVTNKAMLINVLIELDREHTQAVIKGYDLRWDDRERFEASIKERGLRGRLDVLSMLSGQLYISLDMYPAEPGFQLDQESDHGYWEIPTLPSTKRQMMHSLVTSLHNLTQLDFQGMSTEVKGLLGDLRTDLDQVELGQISTNVVGLLNKAEALVATPELPAAITNLNRTLAQLDTLAGTLNQKVDPLLADVETDLKKAGTMLDEGVVTLRALKTHFEPNSPLSRELIGTLNAADQTLNALRQLIQQIQRNPSSLIIGKKESSQ